MAPSNELNTAERTYSGFVGTIKWAVPIIALIVLFIIFLIS